MKVPQVLMLKQLTLENIAVFEQSTIQFPQGFSVITGEPGSGKSLLVDALDWLFGAVVNSKDVIRTGCPQGRVELVFQLAPQHAEGLWQLLDGEGVELEHDETGFCDLAIAREFTPTASRCRLNGTAVSRATLETIRPFLVEIQSQHSSIELLRPQAQREALDRIGDKPHQQLRLAVARTYLQWHELKQTVETWQQQSQRHQQRIHLLQMQVEELQLLELHSETEDEELRAELLRLNQADSLRQAYAEALFYMEGGVDDGTSNSVDSATVLPLLEGISKVRKALSAIDRAEPRVIPLLETLEGFKAELKEMSYQLATFQEELVVHPERQQELLVRLEKLDKMKRLYGPSLREVIAQFHAMEKELDELALYSQDPESLLAQLALQEAQLKELLTQLTASRKQLASHLTHQLQGLLQELAMPHARFEIEVALAETLTGDGQDTIIFQFSANPGESLKALAKVASGGELSRVLLALTVASMQYGNQGSATINPPSRLFVFDEIDTGTSGQATKTIAQQLQKLAGIAKQVVVISHQPVVAAAATTCLEVEKTSKPDAENSAQWRSYSQVRVLTNPVERLPIISRLAGGENGQTEASLTFAQELLTEMQPSTPALV